MRGKRGVGDLLLVAGLTALAGGCACRRPAYGPPPIARGETPEGAFLYFRECIYSEEYTKAWWCLTARAHKTLPQRDFDALFQSYAVVRDLLTDSRILTIEVALSGDQADLTLENEGWRVRRAFHLVSETIGKKRFWLIDLTQADLDSIVRQARGYSAGPTEPARKRQLHAEAL